MKTDKTNASTVFYVARITLILLAITALVAAALAYVNSVTKEKIDSIAAEKTRNAIASVLPGGGEEIAFAQTDEIVKAVYKGENGYAVLVAPPGFDGAIEMMVGIDPDGCVTNICVISQSETAGLGAVCASQTVAGEQFRAQFSGAEGTVLVKKDGGEIDAITGATVTSRAVAKGVSAALSCVASLR